MCLACDLFEEPAVDAALETSPAPRTLEPVTQPLPAHDAHLEMHLGDMRQSANTSTSLTSQRPAL